jgi:hypothetical protein
VEQPADRSARIHEISKLLQAKDQCDVGKYFTEKGCPEFEYDAELDVFRFTEDGRFAFCREFADWTLLWERGYLDF